MLVIFDLDETLGDFSPLSAMVGNTRLSIQLITMVMDQHPHMLRPMIFQILSVVKAMKELGRCKVVLYTNNMGPRLWATLIKQYIERRLNCRLFDFTILGYHLANERTTHEKCVKDIWKITNVPKTTPIFFVDDQLHPNMIHSTVYYFHIAPYKYKNMDVETSQKLLGHLVFFFNKFKI
jgi:hypothetical protein